MSKVSAEGNASTVTAGEGRRLWTLVKVQLLSAFGINKLRYEKDKKKKRGSISLVVAYGIIFLMLVGYSYAMGYGFGYIGLTDIIPGMAFTIPGLVALLFTSLKASATLFGFKDYDILMSLPVKSSTVITSKFLSMYVINECLTLAIMIPLGIAYMQFADHQSGILFIIMWTLGMLVTPLIPMTLATIIGALISAISSRMKHKNLFSILFSFAWIFIILFFNYKNSTSTASDEMILSELSEIGPVISGNIHRIYPPSVLFDEAICNQQISSVLLLIAISVVWYWLFVAVVSKRYAAINARVMARTATSDYKMQELKASSPMMALYQKEAKRFFSSALYVTNTGMGVIMTLIIAILCLVQGGGTIMSGFIVGSGMDMMGLQCAIPFFFSAVLSMTTTTSAALSLEGKSLWIVKSMPIEDSIVFKSKILFNLSLLLPTAVITGVITILAFCPTTFLVAVWYIITPVAFSFLTSVWGMFLNAKMPNYDWENEGAVIKQGAPAMLGIFGGLLCGIISGGVVLITGFFASDAILVPIAAMCMTALAVLITWLLYRAVMKTKI